MGCGPSISGRVDTAGQKEGDHTSSSLPQDEPAAIPIENSNGESQNASRRENGSKSERRVLMPTEKEDLILADPESSSNGEKVQASKPSNNQESNGEGGGHGGERREEPHLHSMRVRSEGDASDHNTDPNSANNNTSSSNNNHPQTRSVSDGSQRDGASPLMDLSAAVGRPKHIEELMVNHARFLVNFFSLLDHNSNVAHPSDVAAGRVQHTPRRVKGIMVPKPKMECRTFKSHTLDNIRIRKLCDELLLLEDPTYQVYDQDSLRRNAGWLPTLQIGLGKSVQTVRLNNNPEVTIGGYFVLSQMLSYIQGLVSLDLSFSNLKAADARVLALGLSKNHSVQEFRMRGNCIGSEGATSMAEVLRSNETLLLVDLRMNSIKGIGVCILADAMSENTTLTELDLRWNFSGDKSDYVETALLDMKRYCYLNMENALIKYNGCADPTQEPKHPVPEVKEQESEGQVANLVSWDPRKQQLAPSPRLPPSGIEPAGHPTSGPIGFMEVTVISARNLPQVIWTAGKDGDFLGLPQAYCIFTLNRQTQSTVITRKDWSPHWNARFSMEVNHVWQVCTTKVMHSKSLSRTHKEDHNIGTFSLSVGAILNWRGVARDAEGRWIACHRPAMAPMGSIYTNCRGLNNDGEEMAIFDTAEEAARAYDETARKKDGERAVLNFSGDGEFVGQHVLEQHFPLTGDDGGAVIGIQAGVTSTVKLRLKYFDLTLNYLEVHLEKAICLPKMDSGLGSCDAYCKIIIGSNVFSSAVVRNSLDPEFNQTFRIAVPDDCANMPLELQVWDWDRFDEDDQIGWFRLELGPILKGGAHAPKPRHTNSGQLTNRSGPNVQSAPAGADPVGVGHARRKSSVMDGSYSLEKPGVKEPVKNNRGEKAKVVVRFHFTSKDDPDRTGPTSATMTTERQLPAAGGGDNSF